VTLHSEFTRRRIDAIANQTNEFGALARKLAAEAAEPIREQVAKTFHVAV
jgi:hypothetical protein